MIQCAARKRSDAGYLRTSDGRRVVFVADPAAAPALGGVLFARPDDIAKSGRTWREELVAYNRNPKGNPLCLLPAFELYRRLAAKVGVSNLFILSAGWGLIAAAFLTPCYDITFTAQANAYKRRRKSERCQDFSMLPQGKTEPVLFFGGKDYLPLFDRLTGGNQGPRIVF